jgi:hypothetical protein
MNQLCGLDDDGRLQPCNSQICERPPNKVRFLSAYLALNFTACCNMMAFFSGWCGCKGYTYCRLVGVKNVYGCGTGVLLRHRSGTIQCKRSPCSRRRFCFWSDLHDMGTKAFVISEGERLLLTADPQLQIRWSPLET